MLREQGHYNCVIRKQKEEQEKEKWEQKEL